jgi:Holliday junction DNA helicase RuvA
VQESIVSNQPEKLYGVTGIGKKTAARIILELRDKILKMPPASTGGMAVSGKERQLRDDAVQALITLGFQRTAVQKAVTDILDSSPSMTVEEVVKAVLASIRNS